MHFVCTMPILESVSPEQLLAATVHRLLDWLSGAPAGLKLNQSLTQALSAFFSYHVHLWILYLGKTSHLWIFPIPQSLDFQIGSNRTKCDFWTVRILYRHLYRHLDRLGDEWKKTAVESQRALLTASSVSELIEEESVKTFIPFWLTLRPAQGLTCQQVNRKEFIVLSAINTYAVIILMIFNKQTAIEWKWIPNIYYLEGKEVRTIYVD